MYSTGGWTGVTCLHLACRLVAPDDIVKALLDIRGKQLVMMTTIGGNTALLYTMHVVILVDPIMSRRCWLTSAGKMSSWQRITKGETALYILWYHINEHTQVANEIKLFLEVGDNIITQNYISSEGFRAPSSHAYISVILMQIFIRIGVNIINSTCCASRHTRHKIPSYIANSSKL